MLLIFNKVLVVFIYIGIGLAANRLKVLPEESVKHFTGLIMGITVPCLVISSITGQEIDGDMYRNTIITFFLTSFIYVMIALITTFVADRIFPGKDQQDRNVLASAMTSCNSGFMGFPIAKAVFGTQAFYYMVIQNISNNVYLFVISLSQLHHREKNTSSKSLREKLKPLMNPTSVATIVSIIMLFTGIHLPAYVMDIVGIIGDITIPLSMMLVGVQLGGTELKRLLSDKDLLITSFIKLIAVPALVTLFLAPLSAAPIVKLTALLGISFPSAVIGVAVSAQEKKNSQLMAEAVACSTVLSIVTVPLWIMVISHMYL